MGVNLPLRGWHWNRSKLILEPVSWLACYYSRTCPKLKIAPLWLRVEVDMSSSKADVDYMWAQSNSAVDVAQ